MQIHGFTKLLNWQTIFAQVHHRRCSTQIHRVVIAEFPNQFSLNPFLARVVSLMTVNERVKATGKRQIFSKKPRIRKPQFAQQSSRTHFDAGVQPNHIAKQISIRVTDPTNETLVRTVASGKTHLLGLGFGKMQRGIDHLVADPLGLDACG